MDELAGNLATAATDKDLSAYVSELWSTLAVAVAIYLGGVSAKKVVRVYVPVTTPERLQPMWFRLWFATIDWHPVLVGGLLGVVPWPVPDFIGHWWFRMLWFAGVGGLCGQLYRAVKNTFDAIPEFVRKRLGLGPKPPTDPPPPPDPEPVSESEPESVEPSGPPN